MCCDGGYNEKTIQECWMVFSLRMNSSLLDRSSVTRLSLLGEHFVGRIFERLCFGQEGERLLNLRIPVGHNAETLKLAEPV